MQLNQITLLRPEVRFLVFKDAHRAGFLDTGFGLLGDERLEFCQLGRIQVDLVEVAIDDLLDQVAHPRDEDFAGPIVEVIEGACQRCDSIDKAPHRMSAR